MAMRPLSARYDVELLDILAERAQQYRPPIPRAWLMNHLLWQGVDPRLDWGRAIHDVASGKASPLEVLRRAADALSRVGGSGSELMFGELKQRLDEYAEGGDEHG